MDQIRTYVERALSSVPQTQEILDLKEELIGNLIEKYQDNLAANMSEQDAYHTAIEGIGDLSDLIGNVVGQGNVLTEKEEKQRALFISLSALFCLLAPGCLLLFLLLFHSIGLGLFTMFVCFGVSAGLILYVVMTRPRGMAKVAQVQRQKAMEKLSGMSSVPTVHAVAAQNQKEKAAAVSLGVAYWLIVLAVYFLISFFFHIWAYSWLLFILALAAQQIFLAARCLKK